MNDNVIPLQVGRDDDLMAKYDQVGTYYCIIDRIDDEGAHCVLVVQREPLQIRICDAEITDSFHAACAMSETLKTKWQNMETTEDGLQP